MWRRQGCVPASGITADCTGGARNMTPRCCKSLVRQYWHQQALVCWDARDCRQSGLLAVRTSSSEVLMSTASASAACIRCFSVAVQ